MTIARVDAVRLTSLAEELADLLVDTVDDGASVGFLGPLDRTAAIAWWKAWADGVAEGRLAVWVAREQRPVAKEAGREAPPSAQGADPEVPPVGTAGSGTLPVEGAGRVVGTVSLAFPDKPNSRHRAELVKLMVHRAARGQGLGRRLLATAERTAAASGITLLHLDTETDSGAERLYAAEGWTRVGAIPNYAADPHGVPRPTSIYFKRIGATPLTR
ncbi:GNAT family N-acetyltransferase [Streptomyces sp. NPDC091377]|uniref:GNAT family N-acetyltransferase n=1 Tax=Streptomyces sp. NPDC091377 TaxID=3365995 RepID=UPI0037F90761